MWRRVPRQAWIGIGLILVAAAIFGGWRWWMETRTWVPLEMPISLAKGHIRSPEFQINVNAAFEIWVEVETQVDEDAVSCLIGYRFDYCEKKQAHELRASWTLSDSGRVVALGPTDRYPVLRGGLETKARELGSFEVSTGKRYVLDLDIPEDYGRFDAGHPQLGIVVSNYRAFEDVEELIFPLATLLTVLGMIFVVTPLYEWIKRRRDYRSISFTFPGPLTSRFVLGAEPPDSETLKPRGTRLSGWVWVAFAAAIGGICGYIDVPWQWIAAIGVVGASLFALGWAVRLAPLSKSITLDISSNHSQNIQWAQKLPLRPQMNRIPGFGLIGGMVFAILAMLMMMLTLGFRVTSTGVRVYLLKPGDPPSKSDPWTEPLILTVKGNGAFQEPRLFVNSKEVSWDDLDRVLKQELAPRMDWVVYVSGDDAIAYQYVASVIDAARFRGAKVILFHVPHGQPSELPHKTRPPRR